MADGAVSDAARKKAAIAKAYIENLHKGRDLKASERKERCGTLLRLSALTPALFLEQKRS